MLTNQEYAKYYRVPVKMSPTMDKFAAFKVVLPSGGELWTVKRVKKSTLAKMRKQTLLEREAERKANLEKYIAQGYAFEAEAANGE